MKKLGEGWQYAVYDLENGRVLKKFHSLPKRYLVILKTIFPFQNDPIWKIPSYAVGMKTKALASFKILQEKQLPDAWLANPKFLNELDFEQDRVTPLENALSRGSLEDKKEIIDYFVTFNQKLLRRGVIDKSFNITKNFGLSDSGEIVLIDIGELLDEEELIKKQIANQAWTRHYVADCIADEETRQYFLTEMNKNFSLDLIQLQ